MKIITTLCLAVFLIGFGMMFGADLSGDCAPIGDTDCRVHPSVGGDSK